MSTIVYGLESPGAAVKYSLNFFAPNFLALKTHLGYKYIMRKTYQILSLSPAPLFLLGFILSAFNPMPICGSWPYEMAVMWFVMFLAHLTPWLLWLQQRNLTRN